MKIPKARRTPPPAVKMMPACLSQHARLRLTERTHMKESVLLPMLDHDLAEPLAYHPALRIWHRLFYSPGDEHHFVAMQAVPTAEVITILPMEFYLNQGYTIEQRKVNSATSKLLKGQVEKAVPVDPWATRQDTRRTFQVHGLFRDARRRERRVWLGMLRAERWPASPQEAVQEEGLVPYVLRQAEPIETEGWELAELEMYNPKGQERLLIPWREQLMWELRAGRGK